MSPLALSKNKKGNFQSVAMVVGGVGMLIVAIILVAVIVQSLTDNNILDVTDTATVTVTNETGASANTTGYTLSGYNSTWTSITATAVWDGSQGLYNVSVPTTNVSISAVGVVTNGTVVTYDNISISYTYLSNWTPADTESITNVRTNWSSGIGNVGNQVPTILLLFAVVILFGALILLLRNLKGMNLGTGGDL